MLSPYIEKRIRGAKEILSRHEKFPKRHSVRVLGKDFVVFKNVFSPKLSGSSHFIAKCLAEEASNKTVLEIGTGSGVAAILSVYSGAKKIVATDINPDAVSCAKYNVRKHSLSKNVEVRGGDLFSIVEQREKFDIILFATPYIFIDSKYRPSHFERAVFDPDYKTQRRFLKQAHNYLKLGGFVMMPISDAGLISKFKENIRAAGWHMTLMAKDTSTNPMGAKYSREMYKLVPRGL